MKKRKINDITSSKEHGTEINDLNALLRDRPVSIFSDKTHFNTPESREFITKAMLKSVCPALGVDYDNLTVSDFAKALIADTEILK